MLFYQHINREKEACLSLKNELEKKSEVKIYIFSIDFEHYKVVNLCKKIKIDMIIMPWMYHDMNYELMQPFLRTNSNMYIINLHHEQIGSEMSYKILLPKGENAKNSVIHFVWGDFFSNKLLNSGVKKDFIFKTGNIRTDSIQKKIKNRNILSSEFKLDYNKKWILFSENRGWVLSINETKEKDMLYMGYTIDEIEEYKKVTRESLELTMKEFNDLEDAFFDKYEIIYRSHPGTRAPQDINDRIKVIDKYSIYEWINAIDINVVWSSTTIFESDIKNIPSFVYEPIENPYKFKTAGLELYPKISRIVELDYISISDIKKDLAIKKIYQNYIGLVDGKSVYRTSLRIMNILDNSKSMEYKASILEYSKYRYYRRLNFQLITKLFVKLNILKILKYPRSAYDLINDIPYKK